ncbi:hypothetical protein GCM10010841_14290 [Deinococcus aerophilus]|uniref:Uncharacterized protein n=2 Tax=Deinococcus aerophilus TaxID=522488 RepID=A0ABQ2GQT2_9DEIO|nr:hypothetical protein GCM10010841_14290 [Deinococcus aerophilus]
MPEVPMNPNALSLQFGQERAEALRQEAARVQQIHRVQAPSDREARPRPSIHDLLVRLHLA